MDEYRDTKDIDYIPHKTLNDYEWSPLMYFKFNEHPGASVPSLAGDGLDYPVSLDVLPPGESSTVDGDVFNRVYDVQTKVYAQHVDMDDTNPTVWLDKASMVASICAPPNLYDWKKLIYSGPGYAEYDEAVPPRMRDGVDKLISKILFLDDTYFELVLTQLGTFFSMIGTELYSGFPS